jgi:hypothetical protein
MPDVHATAPGFLPRHAAALLAALLLAAALHLIAPNREANGRSVHLIGPIEYAFNVDSGGFVYMAAAFPESLATEMGAGRRMRPLYCALGWLLSRPLQPLRGHLAFLPAGFLREGNASAVRPHTRATEPVTGDELLLAWVALVAANFLLDWLALALVFWGLSGFFPTSVALALSLVPAFHFNTIDFVLVPHSEPFNILIPALAIAALRIFDAGGSGLGLAAGLGVALLGKAIPFPAASWFFEHLFLRPWRSHWRGAVGAAALDDRRGP